jgi:hypothetical protein
LRREHRGADHPVGASGLGNIFNAWCNFVKDHNPDFGIFDSVRFDTFWLDKARRTAAD